MLIQIKYADNSFDYVKANILNLLIESEKVVTFKRTSGWVAVGVNPLRKHERSYGVKQSVNPRRLVRVEYGDNRFDYVRDDLLDGLVKSKKVVRFQRKTGWATVGVDPLRKVRRE